MHSKSEELLESQVESLLQEDDYYQYLATPLKSAAMCKQDHKAQLSEFFKFKEFNERMKRAQDLITNALPSFVTSEAFLKIKEELDNSSDYFNRFIESAEDLDRPILLQEMFGLSDETLLQIYAFGRNLVEKKNFQDACAIFALLATLAPHVSSYWIAEGACMQGLNQHEEAIAAFNGAKLLNPLDPAPIAYSIESYHILKDTTQEKIERELLKNVLESLNSNEKAPWKNYLN